MYENLSNEELKSLHKETVNKVSKYHNMQMAKKILLNSCYGAMSNQWFLFYSDVLAESITLSGQLSIRWVAQKLNDYMNKILSTVGVDYIIAVDTDSNYLNLGALVKKVFPDPNTPKEKIVSYLDKAFKELFEPMIDGFYQELADMTNAYEQKMVMKREAIADKAIWTGKKRYIMNVWDLEGVRYTEPVIKMTGIEAIRKDTPYICREYIKKSIHIMINGKETDLHKYIEECRKDFNTKRFEEIGKSTSVNGLAEYTDKTNIFKGGSPMHVRGSLTYNHLLKQHKLDKKYPLITEGDKVKYCYLTLPNITHGHVLAVPRNLPAEFKLEGYIDYDTQFTKTILNPLEKILTTFGWNTKKIVNLDDFFV